MNGRCTDLPIFVTRESVRMPSFQVGPPPSTTPTFIVMRSMPWKRNTRMKAMQQNSAPGPAASSRRISSHSAWRFRSARPQGLRGPASTRSISASLAPPAGFRPAPTSPFSRAGYAFGATFAPRFWRKSRMRDFASLSSWAIAAISASIR